MAYHKTIRSDQPSSLERFAGDVAHEFNNLLTVVAGHCQLALEQAEPEDPLRNSIEEIARTAERGTELARQLLGYGHHLVTQPRRVELGALIRERRPWIEHRAGAGIEFEVRLADGLWPIRGDADQIEQILVNLATRSREAMPNGGRWTLATRNFDLSDVSSARRWFVPPGEYVMLCVRGTVKGSDRGARIQNARVDSALPNDFRGTDLGLAAVDGMVKGAGGAMRIEKKKGRSGKIKILLPRFEGKSQPEAQPHPVQHGGGETILVVDDEPGIRDLILRSLTVSGYNVLSAEDGNKAIEISRKYKADIHLLLTDVVMPGINGRELADRLVPFRPSLKVLFISGGRLDDPVLRDRVRRGETVYLQKPFSLTAMSDTVRTMIDGQPDSRA